jgi:hypothetical protein
MKEMHRPTLALVFCLFVALAALAVTPACRKAGEVTGTVVKEIKEAPGEFKKGYDQGSK